VSCGAITCGTNASTTSDWSRVTVGNIQGFLTSDFNFKRLIGDIRVSNTTVYDVAFTAPEVLTNTSSAALLLIDSFKEKVGNVTLTINGSVNNYEQVTTTAYDDTRAIFLLDVPVRSTPKLTNVYGFYILSSIASATSAIDVFGVAAPMTINSSRWMNSQTHLTNNNPVSVMVMILSTQPRLVTIIMQFLNKAQAEAGNSA